MIIRQDRFGRDYPKYPPPGQWMGRSGKASWDFQQGPLYELHTWAGLPFSLGRELVEMDPSDASTWQRPYVFTP